MSNEEVQKIGEALDNLKVSELVKLGKLLEEKWDVSGAPVMMGGMPVGAAGAEVVEEKKSFDVKVESFDTANKLKVIKAARSLDPSKSLPEVKKLVESAPFTFAENVPTDKAKEMEAVLKEAGAVIVLE